jgi:hypothetical protein
MAKRIARKPHQSRAEVGKRVGSKRSHLVTKSRSNPFHTSGNSPTGEKVSSLSSAPATDFLVENHGSIFLLRPVTDAGLDWAEEHIGPDNGFQPYWPQAIVIEHRFIADVLAGIERDDLAVRQ